MFTIAYDSPTAANLKHNSTDTYFTLQEKAQIEAACRQTADISRQVLQSLTLGSLNPKITARLVEWFGNSSFKDIVERAKKMDSFIQGGGKITFVDRRHKQERVIHDPKTPLTDQIIPMTECDYAYVKLLSGYQASGTGHVGSGMRMYLGERFFHPSKTIVDRSATIYHEIAHKVFAVPDVTYKAGPCRQLAKTQPAQALKNPDNWCLFATSYVFTWP